MYGDGSGNAVLQQQTVDVLPPVDVRKVLRNVYMWMGLGLLVTAFISIFMATSESLNTIIINNPLLMIALFIAQFVLVIALTAGITRMSPAVALGVFFLYAALNGVMFSWIFIAYDLGDIFMAFVSAAVLFGVMTVFAFVTSIDLTQYRSYFIMGLVALLVVMVLNIFLRSDGLSFLYSIVGVILFSGLTAYDTQKIAKLASNPEIRQNNQSVLQISIVGGLTLYLDFINLFLFLLRIFGRSR